MNIERSSNIRAAGFALLGFSLWSGSDALVKAGGMAGCSLYQLLFWIGVSHCITLLAIVAMRRSWRSLRPRRIPLELLRTFFLLGCVASATLCFVNLPMTTAYIGVFSGPMLIAIMAAIFLHERLSWKQGGLILLGFVGVLIALDPFSIVLTGQKAIGMMALPFFLFFFSGGILLLRVAQRTETNESMAFFPYSVRTLVLLPFLALDPTPLNTHNFMVMMASGLFSATGWLAMSHALRLAPAAIVSPFHYSQLLIGAIAGYLVWGDVPTWNLLIGAIVIVVSGLALARFAQKQDRLAPNKTSVA